MLSVKIYSFSYKKSGIPIDNTDNGGGFVFDCRFIDNPGRENEFKTLNGKDKEVIEFLDNNEQMQKFLQRSVEIIKDAVNNYISRYFTDLMVSFGCTGGQHRSVYAAEELRKKLQNTFRNSINIEIHHNDIPR
jgi:RNase adaptor protein for sRNA GlmZ degradation